MKITKQMMRSAEACYTDEELDELAAGREYLTPEEVAALDIPIDDRCWALSVSMTPEQRRRVSRRIALDVIHLWDAPDVVKQYLNTGDESLRDAASDAALAAASDAASDAALAAARAATRAAASDAAWAAASDAASDAALAATRAAASDAALAAASDAAWAAALAAARAAAREKYIGWMLEEIKNETT